MREPIRIEHGALDEVGSDIILRGVIAPESLKAIKADAYQREILPLGSVAGLVKAIKAGEKVPDITLGMRGGDFTEDKTGVYHLKGDVFVIDGLQRQSVAVHLMCTQELLAPHLGCICYFNTTFEQEAELFKTLNTSRVKLSPNILIRNTRENNVAVDAMLEVCEDTSFVMHERICWQQRMRRNELISGAGMMHAIAALHSNYGNVLDARWQQTINNLALIVRDKVRKRDFMRNIRAFFDLVEQAFGIRSVTYKDGATHLRSGFLCSLGRTLAIHRNFWTDDRQLFVPPDLKRKLATFSLQDPMVKALCSNGRYKETLVQLMTDHLNSGRRTRRLVRFPPLRGGEKKAAAGVSAA